MKIIFIFLIIILAVILIAGKDCYCVNFKGILNLIRCRRLPNEISRSELIERLGEPIHIQDEGNAMVLFFETPLFLEEKIRVIVDKKTNLAVCIKCREGDKCE